MEDLKVYFFTNRNHVLYYALIVAACLQLCYQLSSANPVCDTPDCKKLGSYYEKNMNKQGNPCTDFYDYVCHNWGVHNPRPRHTSRWNVNNLLEQHARLQLKNVLEDPQVSSEFRVERAKALYRECLKLPFMERSDPITVKSVMRAAGYWPTLTGENSPVTKLESWWQIENYYIAKTGESSIAKLQLVTDHYHNYQITPMLVPPVSPYGMLRRLNGAEGRKHYKAFLREVINNVAPYPPIYSSSISETDLDNLIKFREDIKKISVAVDTRNDTVVLPLDQYQAMYDEHVLGQDTAKIDWAALVRSFCKHSSDPHLMSFRNKLSKIVVYKPYFFKLAELLRRTPKNLIVFHVHLYFAERHLTLSKQMEANLERSLLPDIDKSKIRYATERWKQCIENHNMDPTLSYMYLTTYFSKFIHEEVTNLLKKETVLFKIRVVQSSWLNGPMQSKLLNKIDHLSSEIGLPNSFLANANKTTRTRVDVKPTLPNAYYVQQLNRLSVSAAYLQWPIYVPHMPYVIQFGSTGFVLAHEVTHGLADKGLEFDEFGHKRSWCPENMRHLYNVKSECFDTTFKKYKNDELRKRNITETSKTSTLSEDIADAMGLKIAYMGYKLTLERGNATCETLPGFESFDCDKMLFIAYGNTFCEHSSPEMEKNILLTNAHSLARVRVNGAVGNMKEFHTAFKCKEHDPMVPEKMCDIWE